MRRLSVAFMEAYIRVGSALRAVSTGAALYVIAPAALFLATSALPSRALGQVANTRAAPSAQAQITQAAPGAGSADELQEVVVTAQFRQESVQQTPLAITALSAATLEQRGQTSLIDLANDAPNVTLKPNGAAFGPSLVASIRGVGQLDFNPALEPGVGIYVDDVYYATLTGSVLDLLDLDRVEVLRGPQGTLAGKNSIGGAVKLYSQKPTGDAQSAVEVLYGSRNHVEARGSTNFALVPDKLFIRFSGVLNHQDGYVNQFDYGCANPGLGIPPGFLTHAGSCLSGQEGGKDYGAARVALRWLVNDSLEANVSADITHDVSQNPATTLLYAHNDSVTYYGLPFDSAKVPSIIPANPYATYNTYCMPALPNLFGGTTPAYCGSNNIRMVSAGVAGTIDWRISDTLSLKSITAERGFSTDWYENNSASPWPIDLGGEHLVHHQFSQELRLNGAVGTFLDYTVGGFYFRELTLYGTHQDLPYAAIAAGLPPGGFDFVGDDPVLAHTKAGFAHTVWHLTGKADFTAAVRYTKEDKSYTFVRLNPDGTANPILGALNGLTGVYSGGKTDYRADFDYRWTEDLMTYVDVSTGFKGGGIDPRPFFAWQVAPFKPETLTDYEVGVKSSWLDHKVKLNLDGFYGKYKNIQLTLLQCDFLNPALPPGAPLPCALPYNAGNADIKGVELETELHPLAGLELDASVGYLDFRYTTIAANTGVSMGMVTPFTPKRKVNAGIQYTLRVDEAGTLTPRFDVNYQDQIYTAAVNTPLNRVPAYGLANARLTWRAEKGDWEAALEVLNLTSKLYYQTVFDSTQVGAGVVSGTPGPPREVAVSLKHSM